MMHRFCLFFPLGFALSIFVKDNYKKLFLDLHISGILFGAISKKFVVESRNFVFLEISEVGFPEIFVCEVKFSEGCATENSEFFFFF